MAAGRYEISLLLVLKTREENTRKEIVYLCKAM